MPHGASGSFFNKYSKTKQEKEKGIALATADITSLEQKLSETKHAVTVFEELPVVPVWNLCTRRQDGENDQLGRLVKWWCA
jgi:hypothetical protein